MKLAPNLLCIKSIRDQKGQALILVLILLLLAGLIMGPLLAFMSTGLNAAKLHEKKMHEFYAADAGIEDALWHLQTDGRLEKLILEVGDWPLTYDLINPESTQPSVNRMDVEVTIDRSWILDGLQDHSDLWTEPPASDPTNANDHWTVIGAINTDVTNEVGILTNYIVDITTDEPGDTLVDHIGVWLPPGYGYDGSVTINGVAIGGGEDPQGLVSDPTSIPHRGGTALIWDYSWGDISFKALSDIMPPFEGQPPAEKFPPSVRLSFDYTATEAKGFFPWIKLADDHIAWDTEAGLYHIESLACEPGTDEGTTVVAYTPRGMMRYTSGSGGTSSAIRGDYLAIGNTLMTCCWGDECQQTECCGENPYRNYRPVTDRFPEEGESSAKVLATEVLGDAKIERAYLYWTGWLRGDRLWDEEEQGLPEEWGPWEWDAYMGNDEYWEENVPEDVKLWLFENAFDGEAFLEVNGREVTPTKEGDDPGTVVADTHYISEGSSDVQPSYQYACFADVTNQVTEITENVGGTEFTVGGVHAHPAESCASSTWNRSSNAGWSMIIIYSSKDKKTHQIYLYEGCDHLYQAYAELTIAGFETPLEEGLEPGETNEAKVTVLASEGDEFENEYLKFKGQNTGYYDLYDVSDTTGVFNSMSSATEFTPLPEDILGQPEGEISGVDIDTYIRTRPGGTPLSEIVEPGDTSAKIKVGSTGDGFMLIYVVFSVRSTKVPAGGAEFQVGTMSYKIK